MAPSIARDPNLNKFLSSLMGKNNIDAIEKDICIVCDKSAVEFKDEISRREFRISGMCQECQDGIFNAVEI